MRAHTHTRAQTHTSPQPHTPTRAHPHNDWPHNYTHRQTHTHTHKHTHTRTHARTRARPHARSRTHTHTSTARMHTRTTAGCGGAGRGGAGGAVQRYRTVELGRDRLVRLGVCEQSTLEGLDQQPSRVRVNRGRAPASVSQLTHSPDCARPRPPIWKRTSGSGDAKPQGADQ
jgi:hypothetical protein